MTDFSESSMLAWRCAELLRKADDDAYHELIGLSVPRLRLIAERMFRDYSRLGRWVEIDDVCQNASVRLWRALRAAGPATPIEFHRLIALQIRRELIDLARRHYGPEGIAANHSSVPDQPASGTATAGRVDFSDSTNEPRKLTSWTEFHERVAELDEDQRIVVDLLWYQGLSQPEAAEILEVSERTIKRRWLAARLSLGAAFEEASPFSL